MNVNKKLPKKIRSSTIEKSYKNQNLSLDMKAIKKLFTLTRRIPGFKRNIIFRKVPRVLKEADTFRMGINVIKKTSEKGIIRLVKVAAGVKQ